VEHVVDVVLELHNVLVVQLVLNVIKDIGKLGQYHQLLVLNI